MYGKRDHFSFHFLVNFVLKFVVWCIYMQGQLLIVLIAVLIIDDARCSNVQNWMITKIANRVSMIEHGQSAIIQLYPHEFAICVEMLKGPASFRITIICEWRNASFFSGQGELCEHHFCSDRGAIWCVQSLEGKHWGKFSWNPLQWFFQHCRACQGSISGKVFIVSSIHRVLLYSK